jgi:hypothetical protein
LFSFVLVVTIARLGIGLGSRRAGDGRSTWRLASASSSFPSTSSEMRTKEER